MKHIVGQAIALQLLRDNLARFLITFYYDLETYDLQVQRILFWQALRRGVDYLLIGVILFVF